MMEEVGVLPHNMSNSSPVIYGDLIFVSTSNGQDESHVNIPSPKAPAIIAINKNTGKLVWEDNSVEDRILHGQWSTPAVGKIGGVVQVVSGQGDGWVRGYEATTGKKLWEFDTNPKDSVWPKTRNEVIGTPVIYEDNVYIANGQDPEHGEGVGHLYAIDATKRGDITRPAGSGTTTRSAARSRPASIADGPVLLRLQRLPALPRREDRQGVLDARHVRRRLGLADGGRRQGLPRRRGRRRRGDRGGRQEEGDRRDEHGQRRLRDAGAGHGALFLNNRNQLFALARGRRAPATATRRSERGGARAGSWPLARRAARWLLVGLAESADRAELARRSAATKPRASSRREAAVRVGPGPFDERRLEDAYSGLAHSSPIVWGDRIYVNGRAPSPARRASSPATSTTRASIRANDQVRHTWRLIALERASGTSRLGQGRPQGVPRMKRHVKASHASATPATDGRVIVALLGSEGLFCFDMNGNLKWRPGSRRHGRRPGRRPELSVGTGKLAA